MTTYWISTSGNDTTGTGASGNPWATVNHANTVVVPGDTVRVLPGTYHIASAIHTTTNGTSGARITYVSDTPHAAIIVLSNASDSVIWWQDGDYTDLIGFEVYATSTATACRRGISGDALNPGVYNCLVHDIKYGPCDSNGGAGIVNGPSGGLTVNGCKTWNNGPAGCIYNHGIYQSGGPTGSITNNISWGNSGAGIHAHHNAANCLIANNLCFANGHTGIKIQSDTPASTQNIRVNNNIAIHNLAQYGIWEDSSAGLANIYTNNCVFGNVDTPGLNILGTSSSSGTVTADPLLVNYQSDGSGDYHLTSGSPCKDTGTGSGAPSTDYDGVARPQGPGFDIGPYEYPVPIPPPPSGYSAYRDTMEPQLVTALASAGLTGQVALIAPDTSTTGDSWVLATSHDLAPSLAGYVRHSFPGGGSSGGALYVGNAVYGTALYGTDLYVAPSGGSTYGNDTYGPITPGSTDIGDDSVEVETAALVTGIYANDPTNKPIFQGEMADGALGPGAQVAGFEYGVEMADFAVQLARAGMAGLVAYLLDDDMHGTQWGLWQITEAGGSPRPWSFIWTLLCRLLTPGSTIYAPQASASGTFRSLGALSSDGLWTFILVNRGTSPVRATCSVPGSPLAVASLSQYRYTASAPLALDTEGFPLPTGSVKTVLARGFTVQLPPESVLILTQASATTISFYDVKRPPLQKRR